MRQEVDDAPVRLARGLTIVDLTNPGRASPSTTARWPGTSLSCISASGCLDEGEGPRPSPSAIHPHAHTSLASHNLQTISHELQGWSVSQRSRLVSSRLVP